MFISFSILCYIHSFVTPFGFWIVWSSGIVIVSPVKNRFVALFGSRLIYGFLFILFSWQLLAILFVVVLSISVVTPVGWRFTVQAHAIIMRSWGDTLFEIRSSIIGIFIAILLFYFISSVLTWPQAAIFNPQPATVFIFATFPYFIKANRWQFKILK